MNTRRYHLFVNIENARQALGPLSQELAVLREDIQNAESLLPLKKRAERAEKRARIVLKSIESLLLTIEQIERRKQQAEEADETGIMMGDLANQHLKELPPGDPERL